MMPIFSGSLHPYEMNMIQEKEFLVFRKRANEIIRAAKRANKFAKGPREGGSVALKKA